MFNEKNPIGQERWDILAAMLMTVMAAPYREKGRPAPKIEDFLPKWGRAEQSKPENVAAKVLTWMGLATSQRTDTKGE